MGHEFSETLPSPPISQDALKACGKGLKSAYATCRTTAQTNLGKAQGKAQSATEKQEADRKGATTAVSSSMTACMGTATMKSQRDACKATAKAALKEQLGGTDVSAAEMNRYMKNAGRDQVRDAMSVCMSRATTQSDRDACRGTTAKDALAVSLGKTASEVTPVELNKFVREASRAQVSSTMRSCMADAATSTARKACHTQAADAYATANGLDKATVPAWKVNRAMEDAAREEVASTMDACMKHAGDGSARKACVSTTTRSALRLSLGKERVSLREVKEFQERAAADSMGKAMSDCMAEAGSVAATCKTQAKTAYATARGLTAGEISKAQMAKAMKSGARTAIVDTMRNCMEAATNNPARAACRSTSAKEALKTSLGKTSVSDTDVNKFVRSAARDSVATTMRACIQTAVTSAERLACKTSTAKEALATSLGKQGSAVSLTQVTKFVKSGATSALSNSLKSCVAVQQTTVTQAVTFSNGAASWIFPSSGSNGFPDRSWSGAARFLGRIICCDGNACCGCLAHLEHCCPPRRCFNLGVSDIVHSRCTTQSLYCLL